MSSKFLLHVNGFFLWFPEVQEQSRVIMRFLKIKNEYILTQTLVLSLGAGTFSLNA